MPSCATTGSAVAAPRSPYSTKPIDAEAEAYAFTQGRELASLDNPNSLWRANGNSRMTNQQRARHTDFSANYRQRSRKTPSSASKSDAPTETVGAPFSAALEDAYSSLEAGS